jgi:hypothetical protein
VAAAPAAATSDASIMKTEVFIVSTPSPALCRSSSRLELTAVYFCPC